MSRTPRPFPRFESAKQASEWLLQRFWDGVLPVNVTLLARGIGVDCVLHEFSDPNVIVESGFLRGKPTIRLSKECYEAGGPRPRFATAHALGHVVMHWELLPDLDAPAPSPSHV